MARVERVKEEEDWEGEFTEDLDDSESEDPEPAATMTEDLDDSHWKEWAVYLETQLRQEQKNHSRTRFMLGRALSGLAVCERKTRPRVGRFNIVIQDVPEGIPGVKAFRALAHAHVCTFFTDKTLTEPHPLLFYLVRIRSAIEADIEPHLFALAKAHASRLVVLALIPRGLAVLVPFTKLDSYETVILWVKNGVIMPNPAVTDRLVALLTETATK